MPCQLGLTGNPTLSTKLSRGACSTQWGVEAEPSLERCGLQVVLCWEGMIKPFSLARCPLEAAYLDRVLADLFLTVTVLGGAGPPEGLQLYQGGRIQ